VQILIDYVVKKRTKEEDEAGAKAAINLLNLIAKIVLWSFGLLFILSNAGINVTSLIAGLGIGGIAVAFALQNVLNDLFSSFAIYFDKPFVPGDFIIVGDKMGVVQKTGIKTTRIKALQGEEIVISNNELTSSKIQNFKKMEERRVLFNIGVTYDTPTEKLKRIPEMIKGIIEEEKLARFDRAHFNKFADSALSFEAVYYVESSDYAEYMDTNERIHFKLKEIFDNEKIEFAFPTQTIYLEK
jgi:small-conductance mechanosensitive channel